MLVCFGRTYVLLLYADQMQNYTISPSTHFPGAIQGALKHQRLNQLDTSVNLILTQQCF